MQRTNNGDGGEVSDGQLIYPELDKRPEVGLKPTTPHRAAGIRTDPRHKNLDKIHGVLTGEFWKKYQPKINECARINQHIY